MFDKIFAKYLVKKGALTKEQLEKIVENAKSKRARLGTIAVSEGMLTVKQADELNFLQSQTDKRLGDLAIEKGYLTPEQLNKLLELQGNGFLILVQELIDEGIMNLDTVDEYLANYQDECGFSNDDMDELVSGDINRVVSVFVPKQDAMYGRLCGIAVRTLIRLIDSDIVIDKATLLDAIELDNLALQETKGDINVKTALAGDGDALLKIAIPFADEEFEEVDLDSLDAVAEFINCVDGIFASDLSEEEVDIDMLPPEFFTEGVKITGEKVCVLPVTISGKEIKLIVSIDSTMDVNARE